MPSSAEPWPPRLTARLAGLCYLVTIGAGVYAQYFVASQLIVRNDPAATAANILAHEALYRLGAAAELTGTLAYVGVTALLYVLLRPVSRPLCVLAACFSIAGCAIGAVELAYHLAPLLLLAHQPFLGAFTPAQLQALSLVFLKLEGQTNTIGLIFFGFYCTAIGWLAFRSGFVPRLVGVPFLAAGLSWLVNGFAILLAPELARQLSFLVAIGIGGEAVLCLWLLIAGVDAAAWHERAAHA